MNKLFHTLEQYLQKLPEESPYRDIKKLLYSTYLYPFNKFEHIFVILMANNIMTFDEYEQIKLNYELRNKYLNLFDLSPRTFGEVWGEQHLQTLHPNLQKGSKATDPNFMGEYDLIYNNLKIDVKASRAVRKQAGSTMVEKALEYGSNEDFLMNFQQLKPQCCDIFIWMAVWTNKIDYWILPSDDIRTNKHFSNQHRKEVDIEEIYEGQIMITKSNYHDFDKYKIEPAEILNHLNKVQ